MEQNSRHAKLAKHLFVICMQDIENPQQIFETHILFYKSIDQNTSVTAQILIAKEQIPQETKNPSSLSLRHGDDLITELHRYNILNPLITLHQQQSIALKVPVKSVSEISISSPTEVKLAFRKVPGTCSPSRRQQNNAPRKRRVVIQHDHVTPRPRLVYSNRKPLKPGVLDSALASEWVEHEPNKLMDSPGIVFIISSCLTPQQAQHK